jgi:hypothetical protein
LVGLSNIIITHLGINPVRGGNPPSDKMATLNIMDTGKEFIII